MNRRGFFQAAAGAGLIATAGYGAAAGIAAPVQTKARIVIAGAGAAGLAMAARLSAMLAGAEITLVDAKSEHWYQPGFTLIAGGLKPASYSRLDNRGFIPSGVKWIEERVASFEPDANALTTDKGTRVPYDFLVVATGLHLDYEAIAGMDVSRIGQDGLGSVYASPDAAFATWQAMAAFAEKGGVAHFGRPATEMKCAGAPLKYAFLTDDEMRRKGNRGKGELLYFAHAKALFSVPIVSEKVRMLFGDRQIKVTYDHVLSAIDLGRRIATYTTPDGPVEAAYDFINVVPPMRAPLAVRNSPLPWQEGPFAADGWIEADKASLRHKRYSNIFAVGDVAGVPKGKTAASVKWQVPVAAAHLVASIAGTDSAEAYNGYTSCPLITRRGRAMLVEFDYDNNLVPSFPGVIAPLEELWVSWVMKEIALKPTYVSMLRGKA